MAGRRRFLAALTAGMVCTIALGLSLRPDPPKPRNRSAFSDQGIAAHSASWDAYPALRDSGHWAVSPIGGTALPARPVYRHSIVPGGVYSRVEADEAAFRMPDVARHYRNVNLRRLAPAQISRDGLYYASYRRDGAIFWTSYRLRVAREETVLGDGENLVRARCGNLLSEIPLKPILPPSLEPLEPEMALVEMPPLPLVTPTPHPPSIWIPLLVILPVLIFPDGGGGGGDHYVDPVPGIPEPAPIALVGFGLAVVAAASLLVERRRRQGKRFLR